MTVLSFFTDKFVCLSKASLYLSGKLSMRQLGNVSLTISVVLYKIQNQLVVSSFEKVLFISVVLTKSPTLHFG